MFQIHVGPFVMYGSIIWSPHLRCDKLLLERMLKFFLGRVGERCRLSPKSLSDVVPTMADRLRRAELQYLRTLLRMEAGLFDKLFNLQASPVRRGFKFQPRFVARTERVRGLYLRRVAELINFDL